MEVFQEILFTIAISLLVSFVLARILSKASACDGKESVQVCREIEVVGLGGDNIEGSCDKQEKEKQSVGGVDEIQSVSVVEENPVMGLEDDWEGIERSEMEKVFGAAVVFVNSGDDRISLLDNDVKIQLSVLHKVAIEGPCFQPQPMPFNLSARAKWNAWKQLANMSPEVAMEQYIALLSKSIPGWMGDDTSDIKTIKTSLEDRDVVGVEGPNFINVDEQ